MDNNVGKRILEVRNRRNLTQEEFFNVAENIIKNFKNIEKSNKK